MIKTFACRDTEDLFNDIRVRRFQSIERQARKRLMVLHAAPSLEALMLNPANKSQNLLDPITPGEILKEDFLEPLEISINQLARNIGVPPNRISEIVNGKRIITADTALRLQRFFGVEAQFWLNLQLEYDLRLAKRQRWTDIEKQITPIQPSLKFLAENSKAI